MSSAFSVKEHLERRYRQATAGGQAGIYLELFSGVGKVAAALRKRHAAALDFEINKGPLFDLCNFHVLKVISSWIRDGRVHGVWFGTPCTTWSIACKPAARDLVNIWGKPDLPPHRQPSVNLGNATLRATCRLIRLCILHRVPCILENPDTSMMFSAPPVVQLARHSCSSVTRCSMCAFGARWRKHTKLRGWHAVLTPLSLPLCCGKKGLCQYSGKKHIVLSGHSNDTGRSWTSVASAYPRRFAAAAATCLLESHEQQLEYKKLQIVSA